MKNISKLLQKIYSDATFAKNISEDIFPTSISLEQGQFLSEFVKKNRPDTVIELGLGYGISSLWINLKYKPKKHIIVDPFRLQTKNEVIYQLIKKQQHIQLVENNISQVFLANFYNKGKKADMVFIDADENFDAVITDLFFVTKILKNNGIVIIRNLWNPSVRKAILFFLRNLPYRVDDFFKIHLLPPFLGEKILQHKFGKLDFVILRLYEKDQRRWNHFVNF